MTEDTGDSNIRPIWLIGGGAAAVVLGICALISTCAAVALIWFTAQTSSSSVPDRATSEVIVNAPTRAVATNAPANPTPTRLPGLATAVNSSPLPGLPTAITGSRPAPVEAVREYFRLVSEQRFDQSWALLTEGFKQKFNCCAPSYNYSEYVNWWNSVNYVDFGEVSAMSISGDRAVVYAELYFVMNTGDRSGMDANPYIALVYDAGMGQWRFEDKRATP